MKKMLVVPILCLALAACISACGGSSAPEPEEKEEIVLTWNDPGEYGKEITLNAGTSDAETYIGFYLPSGTYTVTNNGSGAVQVTVYKDGTNTTAEGWEEPIMGDASPLVVMEGKDGSITIGENEYVKLSDGSSGVTFEIAG